MRISDWSSDVCSSDLSIAIAQMSIEKFERGINRRAIREKGRDVAAAAQDHQFGRHARLVEQRLVVGRVIQRPQPIDAAVIEDYGRIAGADAANRRNGSTRSEERGVGTECVSRCK